MNQNTIATLHSLAEAVVDLVDGLDGGQWESDRAEQIAECAGRRPRRKWNKRRRERNPVATEKSSRVKEICSRVAFIEFLENIVLHRFYCAGHE